MQEIRTKTKKKLTPAEIAILASDIEVINNEAKNYLEQLLWRLKYSNPEQELYRMGFTVGFLTPEKIEAIGAEIRYQYSQAHPDWEFAQKYEKIAYKDIESIKGLRKALKSDAVVLHIIMDKVIHYVSQQPDEYLTERARYLLKSAKGNESFGGLREIGFKVEEAQYLMPYASQIGAVMDDCIKGIIPCSGK